MMQLSGAEFTQTHIKWQHAPFLSVIPLWLSLFSAALQTGRAIKFAVDHVFSSSHRASEVKNRIAVVVTDGKSQDDVVML